MSHRDTETQRTDRETAETRGRGAAGPDPLTERIIACAIEVHRHLGPGLLESAYERGMCVELGDSGLRFDCEVLVPIVYKGREVGDYRVDLIVEDTVVVEIKSVERLDKVFDAQLLTYLRVTGKHVGLLINFNSRLVTDAIKRFVL